MLLFILAILSLVFLLAVYIPKHYLGARRLRKKVANYANIGTTGIPNGNKNSHSFFQLRLLNGRVTKVSELNAELELYKAFDNSPFPAIVIDKVLDIILQDIPACSIEKLSALEYLKGAIKPHHFDSLKTLFLTHGRDNYLLSIEIYRLIKSSENNAEKSYLLDFMSKQIQLPPELLIKKYIPSPKLS